MRKPADTFKTQDVDDPAELLRACAVALRKARIQKGLTREMLARKLSMGRSTLERIEAGSTSVAIGSYLAAAAELGVMILKRPSLEQLVGVGFNARARVQRKTATKSGARGAD